MSLSARVVLRYLAHLAPRGSARSAVVGRRSDIVNVGPLLLTSGYGASSPAQTPIRRSDALDRLIALDRLHANEQLLRAGWLWLAGRTGEDDGGTRLLPLIDATVSMSPIPLTSQARVRLIDEPSLRPGLIDDPDTEEELNARIEQWLPLVEFNLSKPGALLRRYPTLMAWLGDVLRSLSLPQPTMLNPEDDPWQHRDADHLVLCPSAAVFAGRNVDSTTTSGDLLNWASRPVDDTALDHLYGGSGVEATAPNTEPVESVFPLNAAQREVIVRSRTEPIVVVSGPPGTGKSHLAAALATAEVARGSSVLVATQSGHAADVITGLLKRHPGPRWVRFGDAAQRARTADLLGGGMAVPYAADEVSRIVDARDETRTEVELQHQRIVDLLDRERAFTDGLATRTLLAHVVGDASKATDGDVNVARVLRLASRLEAVGPVGVILRHFARRRLIRMLGCSPSVTDAVLRDAISLASAEAAVRRGLAAGGISLVAQLDRFEAASDRLRSATGRTVEAVRRSRENRRRVSTQGIAALATALRSGPATRRRMLRELRSAHFLDVLPLWVGTLAEIDDTLPIEAGMFDVVIFDEASQIDQLRAAPALARARRAVVVGDPRQLRHVSFVSDRAMSDARRTFDIAGPISGVLDIRRNSLFDVAAAASPVTWLDEHFRSIPHIIGFSNRWFYEHGLRLMTQHPAAERRDAIDTIVVEGERGPDGSVDAEIDEVVRCIERSQHAGTGSVGVVTPFRAQSDAVEHRLLDTFGADEIERMGLRVGTVHAFQGSERDTMIITIGLGPDDLGQSLRFVEDPHLFNVMVTRARSTATIVLSVDPDALPEGLLKAYLRHADRPPLPAETATAPSGWVGELADRIGEYGLRVVADYPVAGYTIDLAVGDGAGAIGVVCRVHPDGPEAHINRHLALRRAGWRMLDAFESRWLAKPDAAVEAIAQAVLQGSSSGRNV